MYTVWQDQELSDTQLVRTCLNGNQEAFSVLVCRYQGAVKGVAVGMTHNPDDAADMAQEAFIRAYAKLEQYDPGYPFKSWLLKICANQTKNLFRKRSRRRKAEEDLLKEGAILTGGDDPEFEWLESGLAQLAPCYRESLRMKYFEGLTYDEISEALGIGVSAAKMRTSRGRTELAELLSRDV